MMLASAMSSNRMMDFTVRVFLNSIPVYFDEHRQGQERRIAEGMRRAGLRDHLDERADFHIASGGYLRDAVNTPTPTGVPGGTTIDTEQLATVASGQTADGAEHHRGEPDNTGRAILVNLPNSGRS